MGYIYIFFKLSSLYFIFTFLSMTNFCLKKGSWDKSLVLSLLWDLSLGFVIYGRGLSYVGGICHLWGSVICWWDLSNMGAGFVISGWDLSYVGGFVIYGYEVIFATYFMTVP